MTRRVTRRLGLTLVGLCLLAGLLPDTAQAQVVANDANAILNGVLVVRATVQESPVQITLTWPSVTGSGGFNIYRKAREAGSFGSVYATVAQGVNSYSDTNVVVGTGYEYEVKSVNMVGSQYVDGFVYSGIALPTMDSRGKVILLVDKSMTNALAGELARFEQDLVGDGWTVLRHDVTRQTNVTHSATTTEVATIKAIIKDDYTNDTANVKTVLLFGRVPIPYSGSLNPDGHGYTAREADSYYAVPSETWTDSSVNIGGGQFGNVPGDGVYDRSTFTRSNVKLGVGRVDLSAMPVFVLSETELLRRYLNKDHAFRHRLNASAAAGNLSGGLVGSRTAFSDLTLFDANMVNTVPGMSLWYHAEGPGIINWMFGLKNSFNSTYHVFTGVWGSGSIDYDIVDAGQGMGRNFLASAGYCLTWTCGQPNRYFHGMAMGETIGNCQRLGMANGALYPSGANGNYYNQIHNNLLGDPTLRLQMLAPPRALTISGSTLSWDASLEADVAGFQGYHVYRATSQAGPFTRLTSTPVAATSWTDPSPLGGAVYQVRAIKLEISSTGSYYNNSQGAFATRDTVGIVPSIRRVIVPEGGTSFFQVKLSSAPSSNVTVTAAQAGGEPSLGVRSGASLTFTPGNWNVWQPVTLAAAWDSDNMDGNAAIRLSAPGLSHVTVGAVMADAEVLVSSSAVSVEEGGVGFFLVRLSRPPAASSVTVSSGLGTAPGDAPNLGVDIRVQSGATLTFTQENWDQWQTVTLVANEVYNGGGQFKVSTPGYREAYLTASCPEKHTGLGATVSPANSGTASPVAYSTVVMGTPTRISATAAPGYRFSSWSTVADDSVVIANPASADTTATVFNYNYNMNNIVANFVPDNQSVVTNTVEREMLSVGVPEGSTAIVRVRLTAPAATNVTVTAATQGWSGSDADITVQSGALTFATSNWSVWQTITLAASNDADMVFGRTKIAISGSGLATSYVRAYEIDQNVPVSVGFGVGGLSVTPEGATAAIKGAPLAIRAVANTGYEFAGWRVVGGSATLADAHAPCTTITPDSSASVLAEFTLVGQRGPVVACAIMQPGNTAVNTGTNLTFTATASALVPVRTIRKVEFFRDGVLLGEALSAPYTCTWTNVPAGSFEVMARATDSQGETGDSATIWVSATADGQWPGVVAVGGDEVYNYVTNSILYRVHKFTNVGESSFSVRGARGDSQVEYLVVAGGGGGGGTYQGGGGGAGGLLTGTSTIGIGSYAITVGTGGRGANRVVGSALPSNGGDSSIQSVATAIGGGYGAQEGIAAAGGGSGGGAAQYANPTGGAGTSGQGNRGGNRNSGSHGSGGGGAGGQGTDNGNPGGPGVASSMSGSSVTYANGGNGQNRPGSGSAINGSDGAANTGNGGNGGGNVPGTSPNGMGGYGGSGIVVVRYALTATQRSFPVLYHANGATGGTVPAAQLQTYGVPLTLAANSGALVRSGYTFAGWNSAANGSGTDYAPGASYSGNAAVTLFAKWTASSYEVSYDANGATGGTAPATQTKTDGVTLTLAANTGNLIRSGYAFAGWNTAANGAGTDYVPGTPYTANAAMILYAKWTFFGYQPPAITSTWADPAVVTLSGGTTVHVAASDPDGRPLDYAWSKISGPGTVAFTSPYSSASPVIFSQTGAYVLLAVVRNVRGESAFADVSVTVNSGGTTGIVTGGATDIVLTVNSTPGGTVSPAGAGVVSRYVATPISAAPAPRYIFANWSVVSGAALIADPQATNTTVLLVGAAGVQANFVPLGENRPPVIGVEATADPAETRLPSAVTTVSVTASDQDGDTLTYAWSQVAGQGAATFASPAAAQSLVTFNAAGIYGLRVTVSDGRGGVVSSDVPVTVNRMLATPTITRQPFNLVVCQGQLAGFVVVATGDAISYQWYRNDVEIFSGTAADYSPPAATMADNGANFKVRVSNASGSVMSSEATLTVINESAGSGLTGRYYNNYDFTALFSNKVEMGVQYGAYGGYKAPFPLSTFSVRWTGQVRALYSETYTFRAPSAGDTRLWVNGVLVTCEWNGIDDNNISPLGTIALTAGQKYDIRLDYRGVSSQGDIVLYWSSPHTGAETVIPGSQLYPVTSGTNYAPTITKPAWADMPVVDFPTGTTVRVEACDQNEADSLSYAWSQLSGSGTATFAAQTGIVSAVTFSAAGSYVLRVTVSDGKGGVSTSDVTVTVNDAGSLPVILGNYSAMVIGEGTYSDSFGVRLSRAPSNTVTVTVTRTAGDTDIAINSLASGGGNTTFNSSDWSTPKWFRLAAAQDADATDGTATFTVSALGYVSATVTVTEADNDTMLTVAVGSGGSATPAGTNAVTKGVAAAISATSSNGYVFAGWTVTSGTATFANPGNGSTTVTINDTASIKANFVSTPVSLVRSATAVSVPEGGTATFQLKLSVQPTGTVVVAVARTTGDSDLSVSNGASLTFTTSNWDTYQTVTLAAAEDVDAANGTATFTCSAADMLSMAVTATEADNDNSTLTVQAGTGGTASPGGSRVVAQGNAVTIGATANEGYTFANWSVLSGTAMFGNSYATNTTVTLATTSVTVQANFTWVGLGMAAPAAFTATAVATNQINLAWTDQTTNETGYVVDRSPDNSTWARVVLTSVNATNYSNTGLATNRLYYYRVAVTNADGLSAYSFASARTWSAYEAWRQTQFDSTSLTNSAISGATADPDHDGLNNEQEYWAGTSPTNAASCLVIIAPTNSPVVAGGGFVVTWQSVAGKTYSVLAATNLLAGFTALTNGLPATPTVNVYTDKVNGAGQKFYRVGVE